MRFLHGYLFCNKTIWCHLGGHKYAPKSQAFLSYPESHQEAIRTQLLSCWGRFYLWGKVVNILPLKCLQSHKGAVKTQQLSCQSDTIWVGSFHPKTFLSSPNCPRNKGTDDLSDFNNLDIFSFLKWKSLGKWVTKYFYRTIIWAPSKIFVLETLL